MDMLATNLLISFYGSVAIGMLLYIALTLRDIHRVLSAAQVAKS